MKTIIKLTTILFINTLILSCDKQPKNINSDILKDNQRSETSKIENTKESKNNSNLFESQIKILLNSIVHKNTNDLLPFFAFPISDQNLISYIETSENYVELNNKSINKDYFVENLNLFFSDEFKKTLEGCNYEKLITQKKCNLESNLNNLRKKVEIEIIDNNLKISFYEEFYDDEDKMEYETLIEYIYKFENGKLIFNKFNIAG
jgi:hypothetical protein